MPAIKLFIESLKLYTGNDVFNPWTDYDAGYDIGEDAPKIRCSHLETYLKLRIKKAHYIFLAEALGYQGGHFSGIAMTSERILLGHHPIIKPNIVIGRTGERTSNPISTLPDKSVPKNGFTEPTATIVWQALKDNGIPLEDVILWNIFPFHPYKPGDILSNRPPTDAELQVGLEYFVAFQKLCANAQIVCIGQKAFATLRPFAKKNSIEIKSTLRHPANGGATEFREGLKELFASS